MSRDLVYSTSLPQTIAEGQVLRIPFRAFPYPQNGTGILAVNMSGTGVMAVMRLIQGDRVLATALRTPSGGGGDEMVYFSADEIAGLVPPGSCDINETVIEIEPVGSVPTQCCASGYASTLHATISAPPGIFTPPCDIDGLVADLTYGGGQVWSGQVSSPNCGTLTVEFEVFGLFIGASCDQVVRILSGSTVCWSCNAGPQCPLVSRVFGFGGHSCQGFFPPFSCACCGSAEFSVTISV